MIDTLLNTIPNLPPFVRAAIEREITERISKWTTVTYREFKKIQPHFFPVIFREVETEAEFNHVMSLVALFGGSRVYIPFDREKPELAVFGKETVAFLRKKFGGSLILVPKIEDIYRHIRDKAILLRFFSGEKPKHIAARFCLNYVTVLEIIVKGKRKSRTAEDGLCKGS